MFSLRDFALGLAAWVLLLLLLYVWVIRPAQGH
jgi:hypothetical protein